MSRKKYVVTINPPKFFAHLHDPVDLTAKYNQLFRSSPITIPAPAAIEKGIDGAPRVVMTYTELNIKNKIRRMYG